MGEPASGSAALQACEAELSDLELRAPLTLMSHAGERSQPEAVVRLVELAKQNAHGARVAAASPVFEPADVASAAADIKTFWPSATAALHALAPEDDAVGLIAVLLDFALAVHGAADESAAAALFTLQEEAFQVLPLAKMRALIAFLELRRQAWADHAQGEASIVLLRTGRLLLNRLEPKLHARDSGRVLAYLALSKGIAHASRANRKGLMNTAWVTPVSSADFSIEYAANTLQNPAVLAAPGDAEEFLQVLLQRLTRFTLERELSSVRDWATLTWEEAEKTLNGLIFAFIVLFALPALKVSLLSDGIALVERIEARLNTILASADVSAAVVDQLEASESQWSSWRQKQYAIPERGPVSLPEAASPAAPALTVAPIEKSLGNATLTRLWAGGIGIQRFAENVDWAESAAEFATKAAEDRSYTYMALRCRPWTELVAQFADAPVEEQDLSEWEAKLPKETTPVPVLREPLKRASEQPEPSPKRARMSYEEVDRSTGADRQRAMASTARPLPY